RRLARLRRPIEAIFGSGRAHESWGIVGYAIAIHIERGVLVRGIHNGETGLHRRPFVTSDAAGQDFLFALGGVKPPATGGLHEWNGHGPSATTNHEDCALVSFNH